MISKAMRAHFNAQLFGAANDQAYALIDGAASADLLSQLNAFDGQYRCLYRGELGVQLAASAPYLVKLTRHSPLNEWLFDTWGQHRGIYALLPASIEFITVYKHFRSLLIVQGAGNTLLYFRYYDPRTLRRYFTGCTAEEARQLFGPVQFYLLENIQDNTVQRYWETGTGVERAPLSCDESEMLPTEASFNTPSPDEITLSVEELDWRAQQAEVHRAITQHGKKQRGRTLLVIDTRRMQQQRLVEEVDFIQWYTDDYMPTHLSKLHQTFKPEKLRARVKAGRDEALKQGFTEPASQVHFVTLMWHIGPNFHHFPGFREIANATEQPEPYRIKRFYQVSDEQQRAAMEGCDDRRWYREIEQ